MLDTCKEIVEVFTSCEHSFGVDDVVFEYSNNVEKKLEELKIEFVNVRNESLVVEKSAFPVKIYCSVESFLKFHELKTRGKDVLVLNNKSRVYLLLGNQTYVDFQEDSDNFFFNNSFSFYEFISFLKSQEHNSEEAFHFVDYINDVTRRIVFTSLTEKGRLIIDYYNEVLHFDEQVNMEEYLIAFKDCFAEQNYHLPKFLKSSIIEFAGRYNHKGRVYRVFENLNVIVNNAKINFEIYLNNLSIDKIRKEYDDYKSKYFKEVSDVLNNLTQKIIGLPLLVATTLFAIEKVKENALLLGALMIVVLIVCLYLILLLKINFSDISYISLISNKDYDSLKKNNFFTKYPEELEVFEKIKNRISGRIKHLKVICESYFWISGLTNIVIVLLILFYLNIRKDAIVYVGIGLLFLLAISRNSIKNSSEENDV